MHVRVSIEKMRHNLNEIKLSLMIQIQCRNFNLSETTMHFKSCFPFV